MKSFYEFVKSFMGMGATAYQERMPPLGLLAGLVMIAWFNAELVEKVSAWLGPWAVYLRIPGAIAVGLVAHELYRMIRYQDGLSLLGWIRLKWLGKSE